MFIYDLVDFFKQYSQDAVIVAILVAVTSTIIDKFLTLKQKTYVKIFTPFILGIMFYFLYNVIVHQIICFDLEIIYAGILCGSLSSGIFSFTDRLIKGNTANVDKTVLIIEGFIKDFVNKEFITQSALLIKQEIDKNLDKEQTVPYIIDTIKEQKINGIDDDAIFIIANMIFDSVKNLHLC